MIGLEDIQSAASRISPFIIRTPLERSQTLSSMIGANAYLKMELFQKTGSFKPRGAFNQILQLDGKAKNKGVVAVSGGNFAQGVAYAAGQLGIQAIICMPEYTPSNYVEATKSYGARVELSPDFPSTFAKAETFTADGYAFLHAWDNPNQMAGNGTIGLEILESLPHVTDIVISIGGGGLIAGITVAVKSLKPNVRIWGVETEGAQTMGKALEAGNVVQITPNSLAKTLSAPYVAEDALRIAQQYLEGYVVVSDQEAVEAQQFLLERAKVLTELAASCTLSAARKIRQHFQQDDNVVLLLCGGNESLSNMIEYTKLR
ncbi:MAG: threonine/serine dehydratase [Anaerolineales bacterium]|nr:MAG: threonine/serine dehydratase [Anaerolineales bacterium]